MPDPGFTTAKQAARKFEAKAEQRVEEIKRALEAYVLANSLQPKDAVSRYCDAIKLDIRYSKGAGLEFGPVDMLATAHEIETTPMPDMLRRYMSF